MALHQRYNTENIFIRAVIAGLLNVLNNKITYEQVWSNDIIDTIRIPWFYNMSGDERFMQDFYTHYAHCVPPRPVDGNFDVIPRGIITYTGSTINTEAITSRYVQGLYLKEIDGQLQTMRSFLYYIPLNISFNCEVWTDTQITALKVEQTIREVFFKTVTFYIYYKGMRLGCTAGFPDEVTIEKNINYSFENNNKIKITFTIQVESYQPVFDTTTETNANNYMTGIGMRLIDKNMTNNDGIIRITPETNYSNTILPKGFPYLIEWDYINENAIINKVDIYWSYAGENDRYVIEKGMPNNEYYIWNIPETFTNFQSPTIIWDESNIKIYRNPIIKILPDINSKEISSSSFYIIDSGYFLASQEDASINAVLEMKDSNNKIVYSGDASLYFVLEDYKLKEAILPYGNIIFPGNIDYKTIDIYIVNSVTSYNKSIVNTDSGESFGVIRNVTII